MSTSGSTSVAEPPAVLQLAGHPLRWRLISELARSDRTVRELTGLVGEAQNLVSYHLGKLRDAHLVVARRSSYDKRDSYYAADLPALGAALSASATAIHPGLACVSPAGAPAAAVPSASVLFLCTGNSARSQMAEALLRHRSGGAVRTASAGSLPKPLHPNAVRVMADRFGLDIDGWRPKHLDEFIGDRFDQVITLCDRVREVCPEFTGQPVCTHWSIPDPSASGSDDDATYPAFDAVATELDQRIEFLLATLVPGA